ncbi:hypothetical protein ACROYT_G043318 [Oculina patagonica]
MYTSMASAFVPVDLDKLLDEFEEKEQAPKSEQPATYGALTTDRKQIARRNFQTSFPSIEEEVLSYQGSDKSPLDVKSDSDSDSGSINGVIQAAEAITNQNAQSLVDKNACVSDTLEGNGTSEVTSSGHLDVGIEERLNQDLELLNDESNVVTLPIDEQAFDIQEANSNAKDSVEEQIYRTNEVLASHSAQVTSVSDEETQFVSINEQENNLEQLRVGEVNQYGTYGLVDLTSETAGTPEQTMVSSGSQPQDDSSHGYEKQENNLEQLREDEVNQYGTQALVDLTSESTETPEQTVAGGESLHQDTSSHGYKNDSTPQDQSCTVHLDQPESSIVPAADDSETYFSEVNETPNEEMQDFSAQDEAENQHIDVQDEFSGIASDHVSEQDGFETDNQPLPTGLEERTQSPVLTMTMQSHGSLEARRISSGEACLGKVPPIWVPDSVATHCMNCGLKFSVIKRRHHCRACGKALCSSCCNMKFLLPYMDNKEGRVCQVCCNALLRAQALSQVLENRSNENLASDFNSVLQDSQDVLLEDVLEEDEELPEDLDQQEIAEGAEAIGDDTANLDLSDAGVDVTTERSPLPVLPPLQLPVVPPTDTTGTPLSTPTSPALSDDSDCLFRLDVDNVRSLLPQDITALPPVLRVKNEEISIQERPDPAEIMYQLKGLHETIVFLLNKNLVVKVSIVKLSCCVKRKCWCFVTEGMGAANQEEMVVLLECLRKEAMLPKDVLSHFNTAFAYAKQGHTVSELGYTIFGQPFLGSSDNAGFLYVKPSFQCLKNIPVPSTPYVVGVLIKRLETPWAQLFPLRLQLRLGAEFRYYPCPLFSLRNRSTVYGEIGHTIMNLLADFKNFQKKTLVRLPQDRYDEVVKILNATDEHVMALGANFSLQADSHLVCMQNEQGYKTQAINIQNQARKVTGASFVVFSGALKPSSPFMAKVNIVEDGIMVQLMPEVIDKLRHALKEMQDYTITTGIPGGGEEELVIVEWVSRQNTPQQSSLCSPIDGLQLGSFPSVKVHSGCDFTRKNVFRIQWTEVYFLGEGQQSVSRNLNKLTGELAKAFCQTLMPHLSKLSSDGFNFIGLRVNLDPDSVGYFTGSNQQLLPASIMSDLDDVLVPVIHSAANHQRWHSLSVELLFKILRLL